eukprot:TRINITY_DN429_c0_g1_i3.p2 TRINITY_DN429_c0_g1~~TRINITY_DN429_c0_g1_i3.p2  ORF type:complete len:106 (+),score=1.17 TRINITY_DN429_c0_g1_i3:216-533(+)
MQPSELTLKDPIQIWSNFLSTEKKTPDAQGKFHPFLGQSRPSYLEHPPSMSEPGLGRSVKKATPMNDNTDEPGLQKAYWKEHLRKKYTYPQKLAEQQDVQVSWVS